MTPVRDWQIVRWYRSRTWLGRRVVLIAIALFVCWVITSVIEWCLLEYDVANSHEVFVGALIAWTGELLFFSIIGAIVTVVTLKDPAHAPFEERVRILYGIENLPEAVTEYNKREISRLAGYAQLATRLVILDEYRADIGAYKARVTTEYNYRNLLADVDYEAPLPWRLNPDKIVSTPQVELGRIVSIKIGDEEHIKNHAIVVDENGFKTELTLRMAPKGEAKVVFKYQTWMKVGELQTHHARRFTEKFTMSIVNECNHSRAAMKLDGKPEAIELVFNIPYPFSPVQSVAPDEKIFVFSLLPPP